MLGPLARAKPKRKNRYGPLPILERVHKAVASAAGKFRAGIGHVQLGGTSAAPWAFIPESDAAKVGVGSQQPDQRQGALPVRPAQPDRDGGCGRQKFRGVVR